MQQAWSAVMTLSELPEYPITVNLNTVTPHGHASVLRGRAIGGQTRPEYRESPPSQNLSSPGHLNAYICSPRVQWRPLLCCCWWWCCDVRHARAAALVRSNLGKSVSCTIYSHKAAAAPPPPCRVRLVVAFNHHVSLPTAFYAPLPSRLQVALAGSPSR